MSHPCSLSDRSDGGAVRQHDGREPHTGRVWSPRLRGVASQRTVRDQVVVVLTRYLVVQQVDGHLGRWPGDGEAQVTL